MKKVSYWMIAAAALFFAACGGAEKPEATQANEAAEVAPVVEAAVAYNVDAAASKLMWTGTKLGQSDHVGTIAIQSGVLQSNEGKLTAGEFVIDMAQMTNEDAGDKAADLIGHLSSPDFFNVAEYPTSTFAITGVEVVGGEEGVTHHVSGNLTIMGISKEIKIPANIKMDGTKLMANADFTINRTDWGVKYGSGSFFDDLGDNVIGDDITFKLALVAAK